MDLFGFRRQTYEVDRLGHLLGGIPVGSEEGTDLMHGVGIFVSTCLIAAGFHPGSAPRTGSERNHNRRRVNICTFCPRTLPFTLAIWLVARRLDVKFTLRWVPELKPVPDNFTLATAGA